MGEGTGHPPGALQTRASLAADLARLGCKAGGGLIVHVSLSRIGWVCGGAVAMIQALTDAVTSSGTLVMPAHSPDSSDPASWTNPPVPPEWWEPIREAMPAFDPRVTPTWGLGRTAELFRTWPGVVRSDHPHWSFSAWGAQARAWTDGQPSSFAMGEGSPLARLYDAEGDVLLLGVGYESNTVFHLAEYRAGRAVVGSARAPMEREGQRSWRTFDEIGFDTDPFEALGAAFDRTADCRRGRVGEAEARLFPVRRAVDFAVEWIREGRG